MNELAAVRTNSCRNILNELLLALVDARINYISVSFINYLFIMFYENFFGSLTSV